MDGCRTKRYPVGMSPHSFAFFIAISVCQFLLVPRLLRAETPGRAPIEVGTKKQLFFDDYLVASTTNISRRIHPAEKSKSNPVIRQTESWEDAFNILYG